MMNSKILTTAPTQQVEIRIATPEDTTVIALLGRITFSESHGKYIDDKNHLIDYNNKSFSVEKTRALLEDSNNVFYIAFINEFPVGYGKLVLNNKAAENIQEASCRLERIYVLDEFLTSKIGYQLLQIMLEKASNLNFEIIWLSVYIKNERAIQFYKRNDFSKTGTLLFEVGNQQHENHILTKKL